MAEQLSRVNQINIGGVANFFIAEGATVVWGDALIGLNTFDDSLVSASSLLKKMHRDGELQTNATNATFDKLQSNGIDVEEFDESTVLQGLGIYLAGRDVVMTLEEAPLVRMQELGYLGVKPMIANLYRSADFKDPESIDVLRAGLNKGTVAVATVDSDASRDTYAGFGIAESSIRVIHNGIDLERYSHNAAGRARIRAEVGISEDEPLVLLVARDSPEKDIPLFLKSSAHFLSENLGAHVVMMGTGLSKDNARLMEEVNGEIADPSRVHLLGRRLDLADVYSAADVLALTSATESRPLCISEAQACGVPVVVSTDVGDAQSMIGGNGIVLNRDPVEHSLGWTEVFKKRHQIGFPIERRNDLGTDRMVKAYRKVIDEVVSGS